MLRLCLCIANAPKPLPNSLWWNTNVGECQLPSNTWEVIQVMQSYHNYRTGEGHCREQGLIVQTYFNSLQWGQIYKSCQSRN